MTMTRGDSIADPVVHWYRTMGFHTRPDDRGARQSRGLVGGGGLLDLQPQGGGI